MKHETISQIQLSAVYAAKILYPQVHTFEGKDGSPVDVGVTLGTLLE